MKKEFVIFVLAVLVISSFANVYAESRTGEGSRSSTMNAADADTNTATIASERCEQIQDMRARMKCRLLQSRAPGGYIAPANAVPEACRELTAAGGNPEDAQGRCIAYYRVIAPCYNEISPVNKRICLMRAAGIANSRLADETEDRAIKARNYIVAVLYNLEERLENMNEAGTITDDVAADGINKIVEIKKMILEGKTRAEIMPKMQELRLWWHTNISPLRTVGDDSSDEDGEDNGENNEDASDGEGDAAQ